MTDRFFYLCLFLSFLLWPARTYAEHEPGNIATLEHHVHELVNNHRTAIGLAPFAYSEDIAQIARQHSRDMANGYVGMGHEGADERGRKLARTISYNQFAENVAANSGTVSSAAEDAVASWLNSPGHRANIEGNYNLSGIGIARSGNSFFFTQIFLLTRPSSRPLRAMSRPYEQSSGRTGIAEFHAEEPLPRQRRMYVPTDETESDPRRRPGRKRVRGGYVQGLEEDH